MHVSGRAHISYTSYISTWVHTQTCRHTHTHTQTHTHIMYISSCTYKHRGRGRAAVERLLVYVLRKGVDSIENSHCRVLRVHPPHHSCDHQAPPAWVLMTCTHRYTYAQTDPRMHTPIHVCTHPYTYACKCMLCVCAYVCKVRAIT